MRPRVSAAALMCGTMLAASAASAQTTGGTPFERNIDVQTFRPAPGPDNFLTVAGARVFGEFAPAGGLFVNYSYAPFVIYNANCPQPDRQDNCTPGDVRSRPVEHLVTANLLASISLFDRVQVALDIPVSFETGDAVDPNTARPTGSQTQFALSDPRLYIKARILGDGREGPAVGAEVFGQAPIGRYIAQNSYLGDASVILGGRVIGEFRTNKMAVAANAGVLWRPDTLQVLSSYEGSRFFWGVAGSYDLTPRITGLLEFYGSTDFRNAGVIQQSNVEGDLAARYRMGDLALTLGGGAGIVRGVGTPAARVFLGAMYAPVTSDADHDGINDAQDRCPTEPEDRDGYDDADGCPEPDNDQDGILDADDHCPDVAEDVDQVLDFDGCPDPDNDGDGVNDGFDSCPFVPEDLDGDRDDDGCPDDDRDRDGIPDDRDRCATEPEDTDGFEDEDGCPEPDNDHDGINDSDDQCGDQPETFNGYQDEDGCPDQIPDRDHDGVPDDRDQCPDRAETYNGVQDEDGCPEARTRQLVSLEGDQIRILQQVNFATDSDQIVGAPSFAVLDAVVAILTAHPELPHVDVQGHTDNRGDAAHNRDLSQRRAAAVMTYLINHGIGAGRLEAHGFGPDRPIAPNTNNRGRARNRRVEFHVVGTGPNNTVTEPAAGGDAQGAQPAADPNAQPAPAPANP